MSESDFREIAAEMERAMAAKFKWLTHKVLTVQVQSCYTEPLDSGAKTTLQEGMDTFIPILCAT